MGDTAGAYGGYLNFLTSALPEGAERARQVADPMSGANDTIGTGTADTGGRGGGELRRAVARALRTHRAAFAERHRQEALDTLKSSKEALQQALKVQHAQRAQRPCREVLELAPAGSPPPPAAEPSAEPAAAEAGLSRSVRRPVTKSCSPAVMVGGQVQVLQGYVLPHHPPIPQYKSWGYVPRNEISLDVGRRMFYTDEKGETVPASDDEEHDQVKNDQFVLEGVQREQHEFEVAAVARQFGTGPDVVEALASKLQVSALAITNRLREAAPGGGASGLGAHKATWDEKEQRASVLEEDFLSTWCRMCRTYACRLHGGSHPRPRQGPVREKASLQDAPRTGGFGSTAPPCGPHCYRRVALARTPTPEASTAAGAGAAGASVSAAPRQMPLPPRPAGMSAASACLPLAAAARPALLAAASALPADDEATSPYRAGSGALWGLTLLPSKLGGQPQTQQLRTQQPPSQQAPQAAAVAAALEGTPARRRSSAEASTPTPDGAAPAGWSAWEQAIYSQGVEVWGAHPCKVASLIGTRSCAEVGAWLAAAAAAAGAPGAGDTGPTPGRARKGKPSKKSRAAPAVAYERHKRPRDDMWPQFTPCGCEGPCTAECPCVGDTNFCEKYCGCDARHCGNRFPGCPCKCGMTMGRRCSSRQCPCMAAGRECDPDLCKECRPTLDGSHREGWQCNNFRLRLGQKKRVLMGLSGIQGWGAYVREPAAKDEFVGEYCGELVNHDEADRRGMVYDKDDNSYLFNLNLEWVIDARLKGNKLRFANHSSAANCRAEIMMVDGDHRVAILANREIGAGEELFYDYNYDKRVAPDWATKGGESGWEGGPVVK